MTLQNEAEVSQRVASRQDAAQDVSKNAGYQRSSNAALQVTPARKIRHSTCRDLGMPQQRTPPGGLPMNFHRHSTATSQRLGQKTPAAQSRCRLTSGPPHLQHKRPLAGEHGLRGPQQCAVLQRGAQQSPFTAPWRPSSEGQLRPCPRRSIDQTRCSLESSCCRRLN